MTSEGKRKKIAVIGEDEFTLGFRLAGVQETYGMENYSEKIQELISRDDLGIVVANENDIKELSERVKREVNRSVDPVVVPLSETAESEHLKQKIKTVIGAEI